MAYVDGFIVPVPKKKMADYKRISKKAGKVFKATIPTYVSSINSLTRSAMSKTHARRRHWPH